MPRAERTHWRSGQLKMGLPSTRWEGAGRTHSASRRTNPTARGVGGRAERTEARAPDDPKACPPDLAPNEPKARLSPNEPNRPRRETRPEQLATPEGMKIAHGGHDARVTAFRRQIPVRGAPGA